MTLFGAFELLQGGEGEGQAAKEVFLGVHLEGGGEVWARSLY